MTDPVTTLLFRLQAEIGKLPGAALEPAPAERLVEGRLAELAQLLGRGAPPGYAAFMRRFDGGVLGADLRLLGLEESRRRHEEVTRSAGLKGLWPVLETGPRLFALDAESVEDPDAASELEWPVVEIVGRSVDRVGSSFLRYASVLVCELGRPDAVADTVEAARERCWRDPAFGEHWVDLSEALDRAADRKGATAALEQGLLAATPPGPALLAALAIDVLATGRREEGRAALDDALKLEPLTARDDDARLDAAAAMLVLAREDGDEDRVRRCRTILGSGAGATGAYFRGEAFRALAAGDEGRLSLACRIVEALLPEDRDVRRILPSVAPVTTPAIAAAVALQRARDALDAGDADAAMRAARTVVAERPEWGVGHAVLAEAMNASRTHGALEAATRATELNPELTDAWRELGDAHLEARDAAKAEAAYASGLERDAAYSLLHAKRAQALLELGRKSEALAAIDSAIELGGDAFFLSAVRGDVLSAMGRHRESADAYDDALRVEPDNHWALHQAALEHGEAGDYERSAELFERALLHNGDGCHQTLVDYAELMRKMGRIGDAVRLYRRAVAAVPNDPDWRQSLREAEKELDAAPN